MGGIAGAFGRVDEGCVRRMLERMRQRGQDDQGLYVDPAERLAIGHNRLSTIGLGGEGRQPLSNEVGGVWSVLDGEIYNFRVLREQLADHRFLTETDSEVLPHLYEEMGTECVRRLDGMFAFALWDGERLFLSRDPLGIKPLYYGYDDEGTLYFASEIKALLEATNDVREFLPGRTYVTGEGPTDGHLARYFRVPTGTADLDDPIRAAVGVRSRLERAVEQRLVGDAPLGVLLSGGLDSSLTSAIVRRLVPGPLHSFAVGAHGSADVGWSRTVAEYLGTTHHVYEFGLDEVIELLPKVIYHMESFDPALVRSAIPTYLVSRLARRYVKVVITGEGADELFSGYHYLKEYEGDPGGLHTELREITSSLHNTNLQRVDRITMAHGIQARAPFLDDAMVAYAFDMSPKLKLMERDGESIEKWILRKAAEAYLPDDVLWRSKEKFAIGTGVGELLQSYADERITDRELAAERHVTDEFEIKSKEELLYYRMFRKNYDVPRIVEEMGRSRSLAQWSRY